MKLDIFMARALVLVSRSDCSAGSVPPVRLNTLRKTYIPPLPGDWTTRKRGPPPGVEGALNWRLIFQFDQIRG